MNILISERQVSFFTPVEQPEEGCLASMANIADSYLSFGNQVALVTVPEQKTNNSFGTTLHIKSNSWVTTMSKVVTMILTLGLLPLLALVIKTIDRCTHQYHWTSNSNSPSIPPFQDISAQTEETSQVPANTQIPVTQLESSIDVFDLEIDLRRERIPPYDRTTWDDINEDTIRLFNEFLQLEEAREVHQPLEPDNTANNAQELNQSTIDAAANRPLVNEGIQVENEWNATEDTIRLFNEFQQLLEAREVHQPLELDNTVNAAQELNQPTIDAAANRPLVNEGIQVENEAYWWREVASAELEYDPIRMETSSRSGSNTSNWLYTATELVERFDRRGWNEQRSLNERFQPFRDLVAATKAALPERELAELEFQYPEVLTGAKLPRIWLIVAGKLLEKFEACPPNADQRGLRMRVQTFKDIIIGLRARLQAQRQFRSSGNLPS